MDESSRENRDVTDVSDRNEFGELIKTALGLTDSSNGRDTEAENSLLQDTDYKTAMPLPTDEEIVDAAFQRLIKKRQLRQFDPEIHEKPSYVEVEVNVSDPNNPVVYVEGKLVEWRKTLLEELDRLVASKENSVSGTDFDTLVYEIERNAGQNENITLLGGAECILRNICNRNGLGEDAKELVVEAHKEAAREAGLKRHLQHDTVVFIPHETTRAAGEGVESATAA